MNSVKLQVFPISIPAGSTQVILYMDTLNLTRCKTLTAELTLTTIALDAADTLDIKFQETRDPAQSYWDTRGYFRQVLGNASAGPPPYADQFTISQDVDLTAADRNPVPTGSSTGTEIPPGTVRDGPFAPRLRGVTGLIASHRFVITPVDADADASWIGRIELYGHNWGAA